MARTRRMHSSKGLVPAAFTRFSTENGEPWTDAEEDFLLASVDWCLESGIQFNDTQLEILQRHFTRKLSGSSVRAKLVKLAGVLSNHGNHKTLLARGSTMLHLSEERSRNIQSLFAFIDANYSYMKPQNLVSPVVQPHPSSSEEIRDEELIQHHLQLAHEDSGVNDIVTKQCQTVPEYCFENAVAQDNTVVQEAVTLSALGKNHLTPSELANNQADAANSVLLQDCRSHHSSPVVSKKRDVSQKLVPATVPSSLRAETPVPLPPIPPKRNSPTQLRFRPSSGHSEASKRSKRHCKAPPGRTTVKRTSSSASSNRKSSVVTFAPLSAPALQDTTKAFDFVIDIPVIQSPDSYTCSTSSSSLNKMSSKVIRAADGKSSAAGTKSLREVSRSRAEPCTSFPTTPSRNKNDDAVPDIETPNPFALRYPSVPESCNKPNWKEMFFRERKQRMELNHLFHNKFPRTRTETVKDFDSLRSRIKTLSLLICALKNGITPQSLLHRPEDHGELMYRCIQRVAGDNSEAQLRLSMNDGVQPYELLSALIMVAIFETIIQPVISVLFAPPDDLALSYREVYLEQCGVTGLDKMDFLCFWRYIQKPRFRNTIIPEKICQLRKVFIEALGGLLPGNSSTKAAEGSPEEREILDELDRVLSLAVDIKLALSLYLESFHFHFFQPGERFDPLYMEVSSGPLGKSATASVKLCLSPVMFKATQSETEGTDYDLLAPNVFLPFNRAVDVETRGDFTRHAKALEAVVTL